MYTYITSMFPYPSGSGLHIGHWYNYALTDCYCNYIGVDFQPMGFDSFGLPTENYARKIGKPCKEVTLENENNFKEEFKRMNTNYEFLFSTTEEHYQKEVHKLYQILKKRGLVYRAKRTQDYCTSCETVIAKEQSQGGICERCSTKVIQKEVEQTFFKITEYKDRLIQDLDKVDYPIKTKKQQINWLENLQDWSVSRTREWGCPIPDVPGETFDTFVDSSFYTIYYPKFKGLEVKPVDLYVGGNEHACMHLIYSRFITKVLYDEGVIDFDEPFNKVIHQGMILGPDGNKMSKSKGNIINPQDYDNTCALKMALMFIGPYEQGGVFNPNQYKSMCRFLNRWKNSKVDDTININIIRLHKDRIDSAMRTFKFNKVISEFMTFYNKYKCRNTILDNIFNRIFNLNTYERNKNI